MRKGTVEEQAIRDRCSQLRSMFRRIWCRDPNRSEALRLSRRAYKGDNKRQKYEYQCAHCKQWWKATEVQVDHITPAGSFLELTWECIGRFVYNLFQGRLQILCKPCHNIKTKLDKDK
jgi:5-methylcytosine-specific restriction endonuclease McrA